MTNEHLLTPIRDRLIHEQETIAVAESVTSGLLQFMLSQVEESSRFYEGGITVYNLQQKIRQLAVDPVHARQTNCVSEKIAEQMARHVVRLFRSNWGIGITGYASPVPEGDNRVYAYLAIAHGKDICYKGRLEAPEENSMAANQHYYTKAALTKLLMCLEKVAG